MKQIGHKVMPLYKPPTQLFAKLDNRLQGYSGNLVFIYGTLKQGCRNHDKLKGAKFIGRAQTATEYSMYSYADQFPYLTQRPSLNMHKVYGELYEVDDALLGELDTFEGVEDDFYYRDNVNVTLLPENNVVSAYVYFMNNTVNPVIPIDLWEERDE